MLLGQSPLFRELQLLHGCPVTSILAVATHLLGLMTLLRQWEIVYLLPRARTVIIPPMFDKCDRSAVNAIRTYQHWIAEFAHWHFLLWTTCRKSLYPIWADF